jgi:hypothetical protein
MRRSLPLERHGRWALDVESQAEVIQLEGGLGARFPDGVLIIQPDRGRREKQRFDHGATVSRTRGGVTGDATVVVVMPDTMRSTTRCQLSGEAQLPVLASARSSPKRRKRLTVDVDPACENHAAVDPLCGPPVRKTRDCSRAHCCRR